MTVEENVSLVNRVKGLPARELNSKLLIFTNGWFRGFRFRYPRELSGGQRQRVGIARALAVNRKFCFWMNHFQHWSAYNRWIARISTKIWQETGKQLWWFRIQSKKRFSSPTGLSYETRGYQRIVEVDLNVAQRWVKRVSKTFDKVKLILEGTNHLLLRIRNRWN